LVLAFALVFVSGVVVAAPFANLDPSGVLAGRVEGGVRDFLP
jgi:hypothetical protein